MLSRIRIDNHRCFVNFDFRPKPKQLILGLNGAGKSAFLGVLQNLRDFALAGSKVDALFNSENRTRWQTLSRQTFELEVIGNAGIYLYTLWVETDDSQPRSRVIKESLDFNEQPLILFHEDQVRLFDDNHLEKAIYPFDSDRSAVAVLGPRKANSKIDWFKNWLYHLYCLRIDPSQMGAEAKVEAGSDEYPEDDLSNFAAWYGHIIQERTASTIKLQQSLREVIDGFDSLDLKKVGRRDRELLASFRGQGAKKSTLEFDLDELSDGQKVLIALYTLLHFAVERETTICIDEPDNFLALAEIQPWLLELSDRIDDESSQVILVSHHPEVIDMLAPKHGVVFYRDGFGPVRAEQYRSDLVNKLRPSELIARGWERE